METRKLVISHQDKGLMVDTRARTIEAHKNTSLTNNQDEQSLEIARVTALEQQVQSLNQSL